MYKAIYIQTIGLRIALAMQYTIGIVYKGGVK